MPRDADAIDTKTELFHVTQATALPLVIHRGALTDCGAASPDGAKRLFARHRWTGAWANGIYDYDHYHATTHEVLGIVAGDARVQFGGESGPIIAVWTGDVVVIPAGVSHRREAASADLCVIGAYPGEHAPDCEPDIRRDDPLAQAERIAAVGLPDADPVFGPEGPLLRHWMAARIGAV